MIRIILVVILLHISTTVHAGNRCFCKPYYQPYYQVQDVQKVYVINKVLKLSPLKQDVIENQAVDLIIQKIFDDVKSAIPLPEKTQSVPRKFEFVNTMPTIPSKQTQTRQQQTIQTQTITQTLYGVVQQNLVVQGGVVSVDVPLNLIVPSDK